MLITAGIQDHRAIRHRGELPAIKNSATPGLVTRAAWFTERKVCTNVSRYLFWTVRGWTNSAPL